MKPKDRLAALDWDAIEASLDARGFASLPKLLDRNACDALIRLYADPRRFRKRVEMQRHGYGRGDYQYFADPLPALVSQIRTAAYPYAAGIANAWERKLRTQRRWPERLVDLRARCAAAGQPHPTPLLLRYEAGGYNCLHRDLYGPLVFPLQLAVFLSEPGRDYQGGAFLLVEQRPRSQSVGEALLPRRGEAVLFASAQRPRSGARGFHRAGMRHGVATVTHGRRWTLGVIFHDADA